jgi:O-antigen/teichoic acid export membrane protein
VYARKSLLILIARFSSQVLSFIALLFITRYLGAEIYGSLTFSMALVATFNGLADLGFNSANIKRISEGQDLNDCVSTFATLKLVLTGLMVGVTAVLMLFYTYFLGRGLSDTNFQLLLMFIGYYVFYDLAGIAIYTFDAKMETAKSQTIQMMDPLFRVPLVILVALNRMSVYSLALAFLVGAIAVFALSMVMIVRSGIRWRRPTLFRSYLKFAAPLAIASIIGIIWANIDKIVVGFFGTSVDLALYNSGLSLMGILATVGAGVSIITFPLFSKYYIEGKLDLIRQHTKEAERYISMMIMPVVVVVFVFPYATASILLGGDFIQAGGPLQIIVITTAVGLLNLAYGAQFPSTNRNDLTLRLIIFTLVANTILLVLLVPDSILGVRLFGLKYMGAAYAGLITALAAFVIVRAAVWKLTGTGSNPRILIHLGVAAMTGTVLYLFGTNLYSVQHLYDLMAIGLISVGLYFGMLYALKEFTKKDLDYLLEVANAKKMWRYIVTELRGEKAKQG